MDELRLRPSAKVEGLVAYRVARSATPVDLYLDGNEGAWPPQAMIESIVEAGVSLARNYPKAGALEEMLAARLGVEAAQVLVTAGADDGLDRVCRAMLEPGRTMILPEPSFEMLGRYARLAGGEVVSVAWPGGAFPVNDVLAAVDESTRVIVVVTPNNPTGAVAGAEDVQALSKAAPHAVVLVDHAYVEFSEHDLTAVALELPNVVVARTLSKAWGMAGLRVGYMAGSAEVIGWLRAVGQPYAVSGPSLVMAAYRLRDGQPEIDAFVERIKSERADLEALLTQLGQKPVKSHANFVYGRFDDAVWVRDALAGLGIGIRAFAGRAGMEDALRITCPGTEAGFARLRHGLETVFAPEAILFDMDGVIADVSRSYRQAIIETAKSFGVEVTGEDIAAVKAQGNANNDWVVTQRMLAARGVDVSFEDVKQRFEDLYQGTDGVDGLCMTETMLCERALFERLSAKLPLAIVTGRPRSDAKKFLEQWGIAEFFQCVVCMEDAALKPDPAPVLRALEQLGVKRAWMIGDTPDDARAARAAGVIPLGIVAPGEDPAVSTKVLEAAGAGRVLESLAELEGWLR